MVLALGMLKAAESRIQGSSDLSVLTETGEKQAERCKKALENIHFDQCFSSPISRAKEDGLGTNKSSDQVSNKNMNEIMDTDSTTPALYSHSKEHPTRSNNNNINKRKMKMDHRSNTKKREHLTIHS